MATGVFKFVWSLVGANYKITNPNRKYFAGGGGWDFGRGAAQFKNLIQKNFPVYKTLLSTINLHKRQHSPSSIKTCPYWWTTDSGVKIVAFRIAANMMAQNERGQWNHHKGENGRQLSNKTMSSPYLRRTFVLTNRCRCRRQKGVLGYSTSVNIIQIASPPPLPPGKNIYEVCYFIISAHQWPNKFKNPSGHTTVSQTGFFWCQWPYHGPGLWDRGMVIDISV